MYITYCCCMLYCCNFYFSVSNFIVVKKTSCHHQHHLLTRNKLGKPQPLRVLRHRHSLGYMQYLHGKVCERGFHPCEKVCERDFHLCEKVCERGFRPCEKVFERDFHPCNCTPLGNDFVQASSYLTWFQTTGKYITAKILQEVILFS